VDSPTPFIVCVDSPTPFIVCVGEYDEGANVLNTIILSRRPIFFRVVLPLQLRQVKGLFSVLPLDVRMMLCAIFYSFELLKSCQPIVELTVW
jgi:hypothetical protein